MLVLRIPLSPKEIKQLWQERHDKELEKRRKEYITLERRIRNLVERSQELSGKETWETYDSYFTPIFRDAYKGVLGLGKK